MKKLLALSLFALSSIAFASPLDLQKGQYNLKIQEIVVNSDESVKGVSEDKLQQLLKDNKAQVVASVDMQVPVGQKVSTLVGDEVEYVSQFVGNEAVKTKEVFGLSTTALFSLKENQLYLTLDVAKSELLGMKDFTVSPGQTIQLTNTRHITGAFSTDVKDNSMIILNLQGANKLVVASVY